MAYPVGIVVYMAVVAGLLGLVVGSFVNCWAWRYVHGESVAKGRSHCTSCGHDLGARDLVPLVSWFASGGKCRYCGQKVSARYPLTEAVCAVVFVCVALVYGPTVETVELLVFAGILLMLSLVDLDSRIIPNGCILAALGVRAAFLAYEYAVGAATLDDIGFYLASGFGMGLVLVVITLVADRAFGRESMGGGDLKLFAVAGFYFGWQQGLFVVIVSCLVGIVVAVASGSAAQDAPATQDDPNFLHRTIPFGPSIAAACVVAMLVGNPLISWYLGLL